MTQETLNRHLKALAKRLIEEISRAQSDIAEGTVMTAGPAPYRRLDCDGRALAYIRVRPRKRAVRVDISGLWVPGAPCVLAIPNAGGSTTLMLEDDEHVEAAVDYIQKTVAQTRAWRRNHGQRTAA